MGKAVIDIKPVHEQIREAKMAEKRSNRWLRDELTLYAIHLNDAQMSNSLSGNRAFTQDEIEACEDIFDKKFTA